MAEIAELPLPKPAQVIAELERELRLRAIVYPAAIYRRTLREHEARHRNACLQKAIRDLEKYYNGEPLGR